MSADPIRPRPGKVRVVRIDGAELQATPVEVLRNAAESAVHNAAGARCFAQIMRILAGDLMSPRSGAVVADEAEQSAPLQAARRATALLDLADDLDDAAGSSEKGRL